MRSCSPTLWSRLRAWDVTPTVASLQSWAVTRRGVWLVGRLLGQQVWSCGVFGMHVPVAVHWGLRWVCMCAFDDSRIFSSVRIVLVVDCVWRQRGSLLPSLAWTEPGSRTVCHGCVSVPTRCSAFSAWPGHTSHQCLAVYGGDSTAVMQAVSCTYRDCACRDGVHGCTRVMCDDGQVH